MSTELQQDLAQGIVKNAKRKKQGKKPLNKQELLVSVGYAQLTAEKNAGFVIEQKGVQEELKKLGFSEEGAKKVVEEIMYDKDVQAATRLQATRQVFEVTGSFAPEKHLVITRKIVRLDV